MYSGTEHIPGGIFNSISFMDQITSDTLLDGKYYFVFRRSPNIYWANAYGDTGTTFYRRCDSSHIYSYNQLEEREDTLVNFNDSVGTIYMYTNISNIIVNKYPVFFPFGGEAEAITVGPYLGEKNILNIIYVKKFFVENYLVYGIIEDYAMLTAAKIGDKIYGDSLALSAVSSLSSQVPKEFILYQNYPNPFNPTTTISYQIPKAGNVTIEIFDCLGREIKTLVDEFKQQGFYSINFDASHLASGIYFYQLKAGGFISTKKMIVLR